MANDVQVKLTADNAQFDAAMAKSAQEATATGAAVEKSSKRAKDAQAFASQFIMESVSKQTAGQVSAMQAVRKAQEDFSRAQKIARAGYLDEGQAAQTLGAALQRLTAAQNAASEASKRVSASTSESANAFKDVAERVVLSSVGYIAAATGIRDILGSMKDAVTSSLEFGESIERASQKTNLSVGTLSTLHYAAAVTGGDFDTLSKGVGKLDVSLAEAANGNKQLGAYFTALGLNAKDLAGRSDGAQIALQRLSTVLGDTSGPEKQLVAQKLLGKAGIDQIPTLTKLGENWNQYTQAAKGAGVYLDNGAAESLEATNSRLRAMGQRIDGAKLAFTEGLIPGLTAFTSALEGGTSGLASFNNLGVQTARVVSAITAQIFALASSMDTIKAHAFDTGTTWSSIGNKLKHPMTATWSDPNSPEARQLAAAARERAKAEQLMKIANGEQGSAPPVLAPKSPEGAKPALQVTDPAAAAAAEAAARKAAEARLHAMEAELAEMKQQNSVTVKAEYEFWQERISAFKKGSDQYNAIVEKESQLAVAGARAAGEALRVGMKKIRETANLSPDEANRAVAENGEQQVRLAENISMVGERWKAYNSEIAKNAELLIKSNLAMREVQLEHGVKAGSVTRSDAAQQLGQIHSEASAAEIGVLRKQLADVQEQQSKLNLYTKEGSDEAPRLGEQAQSLQNQIDSASAAAKLQEVKDAYAAFAETGLGGAVSALQAFTAASMDSAAQMKQLTDTVLNDANRAILTDLTGNREQRRGAWTGAGKSIFTSVADQALKKGEGSLMGALGIGKLGTRGNPMFVKNADSMAGSAAELGKSLFGAKGPAMPAVSAIPAAVTAASSSGGWLGGLFKVFAGLIPHMATGGDFTAGTTALVGEEGPEVVHFGSAGHVTPNGKTSFSGGDTVHHWNIPVDARGSTDPAQTMAMVQRGIMAAAPHIISASLKAHKDNNDRLAPSARR